MKCKGPVVSRRPCTKWKANQESGSHLTGLNHEICGVNKFDSRPCAFPHEEKVLPWPLPQKIHTDIAGFSPLPQSLTLQSVTLPPGDFRTLCWSHLIPGYIKREKVSVNLDRSYIGQTLPPEVHLEGNRKRPDGRGSWQPKKNTTQAVCTSGGSCMVFIDNSKFRAQLSGSPVGPDDCG